LEKRSIIIYHYHNFITRHKQIRENTLQNSFLLKLDKPWQFWHFKEACVGKPLWKPILILAAVTYTFCFSSIDKQGVLQIQTKYFCFGWTPACGLAPFFIND